MSKDMQTAIRGWPTAANTATDGFISNASGLLHDGWSNNGGQAGVHLNLGHKRAQENYGYDQQLRVAANKVTGPALDISHATRRQAGTTGPRKLRTRTGAGRKIAVGTSIG